MSRCMHLNTYTCVHAELPTPTAHKESLPKKALQEEPCQHLIRRMLPSMSQMSFVSSALVLASCKAGQLVARLSASRARTASADQAPHRCGSHEHVVWDCLLQGFCVHLNKLGCLEAASAQCRGLCGLSAHARASIETLQSLSGGEGQAPKGYCTVVMPIGELLGQNLPKRSSLQCMEHIEFVQSIAVHSGV